MLSLYIMRHAKSSWAVPGARDFDRELNDRGISDLKKMKKFIEQEKIEPHTILCSSAIRTRQTLAEIASGFSHKPDIIHTEKLYSSGMQEYIEIINSVKNNGPLMIIGHNPMCGTLATTLPSDGDEDELEKIAYQYPTSTITAINFDLDDWSQVVVRSGYLKKSMFPSQI